MEQIMSLTIFLTLFLYFLAGIIKRELYVFVALFPAYWSPRKKTGGWAIFWGLLVEVLIIFAFTGFKMGYNISYNINHIITSLILSLILVYFIKKVENYRFTKKLLKNFYIIIIPLIIIIFIILFIVLFFDIGIDWFLN